MNKAVFIDKDGTLIPDVPYNVNQDMITLEFGAPEALKALKENDFLLIVISNQAGIAHGYFEEEKIFTIQEKIGELLYSKGISLNGFYYCPHHPLAALARYRKDCACRKPKPGMLISAAKDHEIDLSLSWMIGDILDDVEAGKSAGCRTVLIDNGNETVWLRGEKRTPDFIAINLIEASAHILNHVELTNSK